LLESVREALRNDQIALHVQPIVDMADRQPLFFECFSRLRTADGRLLTPQTYLPVVEAEGLTAAIDNMLLLRCVQLVRSAQRRDRPVTYFCNISGRSLDDRVFFADFLDFASDNALLSSHLVFEIDHRTLAGLTPEATRDLRALADLGYRFALDNADLAHVDAALLTDHRIAFVKARIGNLAERAGHDRHLIDLERPLLLAGAELIATHIERESHCTTLANLPVRFGQGFLFGEPAPIESLRRD
ncbi:MAG: EAL domain-containing protein, partial [Alphaproteobacteria bacterium]